MDDWVQEVLIDEDHEEVRAMFPAGRAHVDMFDDRGDGILSYAYTLPLLSIMEAHGASARHLNAVNPSTGVSAFEFACAHYLAAQMGERAPSLAALSRMRALGAESRRPDMLLFLERIDAALGEADSALRTESIGSSRP